MSGNFIVDTNIIIALFEGDKNVKSEIRKASNIYLPAIVIGELFYGAYNSSHKEKNIKKILELCKETETLSCNDETGKYYGQIKKQLKDKGKPIPENDIWIAALSMQYQLSLVSRDAHFHNIDGINVFKW